MTKGRGRVQNTVARLTPNARFGFLVPSPGRRGDPTRVTVSLATGHVPGYPLALKNGILNTYYDGYYDNVLTLTT